MTYYRNESDNTTISSALNFYSAEELRKLRKLTKTVFDDNSTELNLVQPISQSIRKPDIIADIVQLYDGDGLMRLWNALSELQKKLVSETVHSTGNYYNYIQFFAKYGDDPDSDADGSLRIKNGDNDLTLLDLFVIGTSIPFDLNRRLAAFIPLPPPTTVKAVDFLPKTIRVLRYDYDPDTRKMALGHVDVGLTINKTEQNAAEDIISILCAVDTGKIAVSDTTKLPTSAAIKAVSAILSGGDFYTEPEFAENEDPLVDVDDIGPIKAFSWPIILQAGGLVEVSGKKLKLTAAGQKALTSPPADILKSLWKKWVTSAFFDELKRVDVIKGQAGRGKRGLTALNKRRLPIVKALADCTAGHWLTPRNLMKHMVAVPYNFEVSRDPYLLYINSQSYGGMGGADRKYILELRYIHCFLFEYAAALGLIDIGYISPDEATRDFDHIWGTNDMFFLSRYDGLAVISVNSLGAYCLGKSKTYVAAPKERSNVLRVSDNYEIEQVGKRITGGEMLFLDTYTNRLSEGKWVIDRFKVLSAIESGNTVAKLRDFLEAKSSEPLPETVAEYLSDFEAIGSLFKDLGSARMIECSDKAIASRIAGDARTGRLCKLVDHHRLLVLDDQMEAFRKALRTFGYVLPQPEK